MNKKALVDYSVAENKDPLLVLNHRSLKYDLKRSPSKNLAHTMLMIT